MRAHEHLHSLQHVGDVVQAAALHAQQRARLIQADRRAHGQPAVLMQELVAQHAQRSLLARHPRRARARSALAAAHRCLHAEHAAMDPGCLSGIAAQSGAPVLREGVGLVAGQIWRLLVGQATPAP